MAESEVPVADSTEVQLVKKPSVEEIEAAQAVVKKLRQEKAPKEEVVQVVRCILNFIVCGARAESNIVINGCTGNWNKCFFPVEKKGVHGVLGV